MSSDLGKSGDFLKLLEVVSVFFSCSYHLFMFFICSEKLGLFNMLE